MAAKVIVTFFAELIVTVQELPVALTQASPQLDTE
jgi:hypothetical protein